MLVKFVLGTLVVVAAAYGAGRLGEAANAPAMMKTAESSPASGFTLHIDAKRHFPGNPQFIAHHWCRPAAGGITQCQLYDSDTANARLVGVEVVVPTATYKTF
ncbi:MAG TPA: DUF1264 domain-containing protein, partial [Candidatus Eremiobacteraceae bacterium]|nr:DUF1264 domain-containing protein [Candidatus Eremiobacteraceae bacterium]